MREQLRKSPTRERLRERRETACLIASGKAGSATERGSSIRATSAIMAPASSASCCRDLSSGIFFLARAVCRFPALDIRGPPRGNHPPDSYRNPGGEGLEFFPAHEPLRNRREGWAPRLRRGSGRGSGR